jgi:rRNA maturation RNase YbeY
MPPPISFHYLLRKPFHFRHRNSLKKFLFWIFKNEKHTVEMINYIFCSDTDLLKLNQQFLKHNTLTDILTFRLSSNGLPILSDIYISIERITNNSHELSISFKEELHRVIFHGALHLCGYDDKSEAEKIIIRQKEDYYLQRYVSRETSIASSP